MKKHWWQSEIIYQIYPKSFQDTNGDGIGDLQGIIQRLDYLSDLGITSIWICPIFQSPMADNGYDISDYYALNPEFGHLDDLKQLIAEAKVRGIKVILDLVVNHTSDEHPWFQEALANPDSPYRDYYIFKEGPERPNNWRSIFGGSVWEEVPGESTYYYHTFHKKQPDLNWENPALRADIYQMVNWWLELGVAGFRVDAITFIKKDLTFASIPADGVDGLAKCTKVSRNQPGIEVFLRELKETCFDRYDCVTVAEAPGVPYEQLETYVGEDGLFSMIFDFKHADLDVASGSEWFKPIAWQWSDLYQYLEDSQLALQAVGGWGAPFIENHDQPRATSKYLGDYARDPRAVTALAMLYFFLRGTRFIYQGQELGMVNSRGNAIADFDDISSHDQYHRGIAEGLTAEDSLAVINRRSRDHSRTPVLWDTSAYGGFSSHQPWLNLPASPQIAPVSQQVLDPNSVLQFYQGMITWFKGADQELLTQGTISFPGRQVPDVFLYRRSLDKRSILFAVNMSPEPQTLTLDRPVAQVLFDNGQDSALSPKYITLAPFAAVALEEIL